MGDEDPVVIDVLNRRTRLASDNHGGSTDYYKLPAGAADLMDLIEARGMNFAVGNIFKAAWRLGQKPGADAIYDLNKIIYFAEREIARLRNAPKRP